MEYLHLTLKNKMNELIDEETKCMFKIITELILDPIKLVETPKKKIIISTLTLKKLTESRIELEDSAIKLIEQLTTKTVKKIEPLIDRKILAGVIKILAYDNLTDVITEEYLSICQLDENGSWKKSAKDLSQSELDWIRKEVIEELNQIDYTKLTSREFEKKLDTQLQKESVEELFKGYSRVYYNKVNYILTTLFNKGFLELSNKVSDFE